MGGPCDFSVTPSPNWNFGFLTDLGLGLGLRGLDLGLGLDNQRKASELCQFFLTITVENCQAPRSRSSSICWNDLES